MAHRMSDLDALLWALEAHDPARRPVITVVILLDRRPDPELVAARLDRLSRRMPRLRERVKVGPVGTAPPCWEADPEFDLAAHFVDAGGLGDVSDAVRLAERLAVAPFAAGRPPWQVHLAGAALVVRLHHTYTDGVGAMQLAGELFDLEERPAGAAEAGAPSTGGARGDGVWDDAVFELRRGLGVAASVAGWAAGAVRDAVVDPSPRMEEVRALLDDLWAIGRTVRAPGSPLLAARSARSSFAAIDLPLDDVRAAAAGAGGTVNDVFVAGALAGLRLYHAKHGECPPSLRIGIPASTRSSGQGELSNQFVPLVVWAPLQLVDPVERVRLIHALVVAARRQRVVQLFERSTGVLRRLPGGVPLAAGLVRKVDLMASNVPGSPVELYLAGAKVRRMIPFGPRGGAGLNLTLLSYHDRVHIGINADAEALADQDVLSDCLRRGFEETVDL